MGEEKELYKNLKPFLNCKDYTVSGESFKVMKNQKYDLLVTTPIPVDLEKYYKSTVWDYNNNLEVQKTNIVNISIKETRFSAGCLDFL